jgi:hypothetical protein
MDSMSRRKSPTDQLADDISCFIIGFPWMAAGTLSAALFKAIQVISEDENLRLQSGFAWY